MTLTSRDNVRSITVKAGTVLAVELPANFGPGATNHVASSNPTVFGPLGGGGLIAELRAWQPGKAELSAPSGGCSGSSRASCSKPWAVQVTITA
ncbi:MAG: hypothetical protein ACRDY2_06205 [Acidimicrobiales bacterium]